MPSKENIIITIDGPAGAGKGTVAKLLAKELGFSYLDTGAMYRAVALAVRQNHTDPDNYIELKELLNRTKIELNKPTSEKFEIYLNGEDVTDSIRSQEISSFSSKIATKQIVREYLVQLQRNICKSGNIVVEGRDIGTYVFPEAEYKFFLDATPEERAKRRYNQLRESGINTTIKKISNEITKRDKQDTKRKESPLHPAKNAVIIDTTNLTINEVVGKILEKLRTK